MKEIMIHAWEEDTCIAYGAGLLMWHCFCDEKGIREEERALAMQDLVSVVDDFSYDMPGQRQKKVSERC